jgi:hypothetical protein
MIYLRNNIVHQIVKKIADLADDSVVNGFAQKS